MNGICHSFFCNKKHFEPCQNRTFLKSFEKAVLKAPMSIFYKLQWVKATLRNNDLNDKENMKII